MRPCLVGRMPCDSQTSSSCITWEPTVWPPCLLSSALLPEVQPDLVVSSLCLLPPGASTRAISSLEYPPPSYSLLPLSFLLIYPLFLCSPDSFQAELSLMLQTESSPQPSSLSALGPSSLALITDTVSFVEDHWMLLPPRL